VELRLLARIFTPQEAALASVMRLIPESAPHIATRAGVDVDAALRTLEGMAAQGLVRSRERHGDPVFALKPFFPGFYESQLPRMDNGLAALFEQYYQETQGGVVQDIPALHRVLPVGEAIPLEVEIFPHERAAALLGGARSWGVRDCICRIQRRLVGQGCDHPVENCMIFAPVEGAFDDSEVDRAITKEQALRILHEAEEAGLVHTVGNYRSGNSYICNCCTCCCGILRGVAEFGILSAVAHSSFHAFVDTESCIGCGDCAEHCQFGALSVPEDVAVVDDARCVGCGLCAAICPADALHLEHRPDGQVQQPPADIDEWRAQSIEARGIPSSDVL
jgi:electron transport complex protein RnfB